MKKKKILQVCAVDWSVDALLKPLIYRSMSEGYEVHNACSDTGRFDKLESEGLTMIDIDIDRKISPLKNLKSIYKLYKLMKKEKYDIVHVHTPIAALLGRIAAKMAGIKSIIYTAHGFYFHEEMSKRKYKLFFNIEKYAARFFTDWLLLQSKEDYELALKNNFTPPEKTIHLSNGVDIWNKFNLNKINPRGLKNLRSEFNCHETDYIFSFVGRLVEEKGIFELVDAFKNISSDYPEAKLLLVGGLLDSERDHDSYKKLLSDLKHPKIAHLGFRSDIPEIMALTQTFILPSYREGLPRSIIEAMAMETAIIATDIRGCREEVFPGENGLLVKKQNVKELEVAMRYMLENKETSKEYASRGREIVEEQFDEEKVLIKQINLFNQITQHS